MGPGGDFLGRFAVAGQGRADGNQQDARPTNQAHLFIEEEMRGQRCKDETEGGQRPDESAHANLEHGHVHFVLGEVKERQGCEESQNSWAVAPSDRKAATAGQRRARGSRGVRSRRRRFRLCQAEYAHWGARGAATYRGLCADPPHSRWIRGTMRSSPGIGPGNQYGLEMLVWVVERIQEDSNFVDGESAPWLPYGGVEFGHERIELGDRGCIGHGCCAGHERLSI